MSDAPFEGPADHLAILPLAVDRAALTPGADLAGLLLGATQAVRSGDVVVVSAWVVAQVEDRVADVGGDGSTPDQTATVLRRRGDWRLVETPDGLIASTAELVRPADTAGGYLLLPVDANRSARRLRDAARHREQLNIAVIVEAGLGRPWRLGLVGTALGSAGFRQLAPSRTMPPEPAPRCVADEVAAAAALVLQFEAAGNTAAAIVRGLPGALFSSDTDAAALVRPLNRQLFR